MTTHIVVGIDGSPESRRALDHAIEHARLSDGRLELVHAWLPVVHYAPPEYVDFAMLREDYENAAEELMATVVADVPDDVAVERTIIEGPAAPTLAECARDADLLVVGSRGRGGFKGLLLGSTSHWLTSHATCPVLVVPSGSAAREDEVTVD